MNATTRLSESTCVKKDLILDGHHEDRTPTHGDEPMREAAMAAFAKRWPEKWFYDREVRFRGQIGKHLLVLSLPLLNPKLTTEAKAHPAFLERQDCTPVA